MAAGEAGEIVQGGVQVGIGYHRRPELTAERFITLRGARWYRTGDGGVWCGELEVLGRFDSQVKIRGMRVELGEIEAGVVSAAAGLLSNCSVKLRDSFLIAYCQVSTDAAVMMHEPYCVSAALEGRARPRHPAGDERLPIATEQQGASAAHAAQQVRVDAAPAPDAQRASRRESVSSLRQGKWIKRRCRRPWKPRAWHPPR